MGPLKPTTGKENIVLGADQLGSSKSLPAPAEIPYENCIFRDGYVPKDDWEQGWVNMLDEKPWETDCAYTRDTPESHRNMVIIGIFEGCSQEFKPEYLERAGKLSPKFTYLLSRFGQYGHKASFTALEWIPEHHLKERMERSVYPVLRDIFDRHFGREHHTGDDLKERIASAVKEVVNISRDCLDEDELKEDFRGLLFHAGLEDISKNDICVVNMVQNCMWDFNGIVDNYLDDLWRIKKQLIEWNDDNCKDSIKV